MKACTHFFKQTTLQSHVIHLRYQNPLILAFATSKCNFCCIFYSRNHFGFGLELVHVKFAQEKKQEKSHMQRQSKRKRDTPGTLEPEETPAKRWRTVAELGGIGAGILTPDVI